MKWLEKLVLTTTLDPDDTIKHEADSDKDTIKRWMGTTWFVASEGIDETGSGLSWERPTTWDAAMREAAHTEDRIHIAKRGMKVELKVDPERSLMSTKE